MRDPARKHEPHKRRRGPDAGSRQFQTCRGGPARLPDNTGFREVEIQTLRAHDDSHRGGSTCERADAPESHRRPRDCVTQSGVEFHPVRPLGGFGVPKDAPEVSGAATCGLSPFPWAAPARPHALRDARNSANHAPATTLASARTSQGDLNGDPFLPMGPAAEDSSQLRSCKCVYRDGPAL